jgi:hypothetical protein
VQQVIQTLKRRFAVVGLLDRFNETLVLYHFALNVHLASPLGGSFQVCFDWLITLAGALAALRGYD